MNTHKHFVDITHEYTQGIVQASHVETIQSPGVPGAKPKSRNLIEIYCTCYQHWAIYVGYGYVAHLTLQGEAGEAVFSSLFSVLRGRVVVSRDLLLTVTAADLYWANNLHDGHLSLWPHQDIVREAEAQPGRVLPCCIITKNCEHFITQLRYGVPISNQVRESHPHPASPLLGLSWSGFL
ncbi:phospholipase A and acyltransferase 3-like [Alligator mississippiensis]|uniref:phospholipase A and acyltransferase 3-like n=1 Tax=Alligator mississippiensis TaxID=8496 RepID=UPI0009071B07|nr:phospholipase A and acyltransferase 3-like [Alligator mississippiensis]